jgi:hypothetical protein
MVGIMISDVFIFRSFLDLHNEGTWGSHFL